MAGVGPGSETEGDNRQKTRERVGGEERGQRGGRGGGGGAGGSSEVIIMRQRFWTHHIFNNKKIIKARIPVKKPKFQ